NEYEFFDLASIKLQPKEQKKSSTPSIILIGGCM
ncbi:MAG: hypothetical protein ACI9LX_003416, partial [Paraglaciecola sp.]